MPNPTRHTNTAPQPSVDVLTRFGFNLRGMIAAFEMEYTPSLPEAATKPNGDPGYKVVLPGYTLQLELGSASANQQMQNIQTRLKTKMAGGMTYLAAAQDTGDWVLDLIFDWWDANPTMNVADLELHFGIRVLDNHPFRRAAT